MHVVSGTAGTDSVMSGEPESAVVPVPPRFRWLNRFGKAAVVLVVAALLFRVWWGYEAHRRLQAQIDEYRAAGQLVYAKEFDAEMDAVPDDQNAAILYEEAIRGIVSTSTSGVHIDKFRDEPGRFSTDSVAARELMQSNSDVLQLVRQTRERPQIAWSDRLAEQLVGGRLGSLSGHRRLGRLLWFSAHYHFTAGNHNEAIEATRDLLTLGQASGQFPNVLSVVVGQATQGVACQLVEDVAARLLVGVEQANTDAMTTSRVAELIRALLDERGLKAAWVQQCYGDRSFPIATIDSAGAWGATVGGVSPQELWDEVINWLERPILELDAARQMRQDTRAADAGVQPSYPDAVSVFAADTVPQSLVHSYSRPFTGGGAGASARSLELFFRVRVMRRMAAVALAIRLYVVDHGIRPATLDMLAPDYLSEVPVDLFSAVGAPLGYKPDANRPVIYSVGRDGNDHGGVEARKPDGRRDLERSDIPFYLDGKSVEPSDTAAQPSREAVDDDENGDDAAGDRK